MKFDESVNYLLSLGNEVLAMKLGLENIRKLLAALGNPQNNYLKIQIAGTNGKGSTVAFLESICVSAKINVGATTSPHLISITERVRINGKEISETDFARYATKVRETSERLVETGELETVPTYFEQVTAIALTAFAEAKIELAILETGLGGRFDATTAANAEIAAITPIDFDHQNILGNSLEEIAAEKAAIIRENSRVIFSKQKEEAEKIILEVCEKSNVKPKTTTFKSEIKNVAEHGKFIVNFETEKAIYENVKLNLSGKHQIENAKVAVLLAEILIEDFKFKISASAIYKGLESAEHKGRLEFNGKYLFDGAHNISGAKALREFLDEFVTQPITVIFGAMRDKDLTEIAEVIFPKAENLILTIPDNPRSFETPDLLKFVPMDFNREKVFLTGNVNESIVKAREISGESNLILITGSLYLVGEAQRLLKDSF